ncbi:MAG: hypothetical protein HYX92_22100 [Chloroflexi bacterium]|nr:hypothetical protein [Chloroflexota bacterium]
MEIALHIKAYRYVINLLLKQYRIVVNGLLLGWLTIGVLAVATNNIALGFIYLGLIALKLLAVAYADCRTCPRRSGRCTHFFLGRLSTFLLGKKPVHGSFGGHAPIGVMWIALHLFPQYWLLPNKLLLALFWLLPILAILFLRFEVCWKVCGNVHCPLNKVSHPFAWEKHE